MGGVGTHGEASKHMGVLKKESPHNPYHMQKPHRTCRCTGEHRGHMGVFEHMGASGALGVSECMETSKHMGVSRCPQV